MIIISIKELNFKLICILEKINQKNKKNDLKNNSLYKERLEISHYLLCFWKKKSYEKKDLKYFG